MKKPILLSICITAILFIGCATTGNNSFTPYTNEKYKPKPKDYTINILDRASIDREYTVIGEINEQRIIASNDKQQVLKEMKATARKMGGDALIDYNYRSEDTSTSWIPSKDFHYSAKVIVFTDTVKTSQ